MWKLLTVTFGELRREGLYTSRSAGGTVGRRGRGGANVQNNEFVVGVSGLDSTLLTDDRILEPC